MDTKNYTQVLIDGKIYTLGETECRLSAADAFIKHRR